MSTENNYAFIDGQNLHAGTGADGWKIDHKKFREYLEADLGVTKAYIFIGFMEEQQTLYNALQEAGFILFFKPLIRHEDGVIKGNVDADMVLQCMIEIENYDNAVIVSGDGDFAGLIRHLVGLKKLKKVLIPNKHTYSSLFKRMDEFGDEYFGFMEDLKTDLAYRIMKRRNYKPKNAAPKAAASEPKKTTKKTTKEPTMSSQPEKKPTQRRQNQQPQASQPSEQKPRSKKLKSKKQVEASLLKSIEQSYNK